MGAFLVLIGFLSMIVGVVMFVVSLFKKTTKKRPAAIIAAGFIVFIIGGATLSDNNEVVEREEEAAEVTAESNDDEELIDTKERNSVEKEDDDENPLEILEFTGSMTATATDGKIAVNIETNAIDGSVFEVVVVDGNLNFKSDFLEVKNGNIDQEFEIPSDWEPAHFAYNAMFRFNSEDHQQPQHVKDFYGESGENLVGELTDENNLGGKNATIDGGTVAYPNEDVLKDHQDNLFNNAISELITVGNGVILDVEPMSGSDWSIVNVFVSDDWYYTPEHERERFVESVGSTVEQIVTGTGKVEGVVSVYFRDEYGKELASPKMFGGYKLK